MHRRTGSQTPKQLDAVAAVGFAFELVARGREALAQQGIAPRGVAFQPPPLLGRGGGRLGGIGSRLLEAICEGFRRLSAQNDRL